MRPSITRAVLMMLQISAEIMLHQSLGNDALASVVEMYLQEGTFTRPLTLGGCICLKTTISEYKVSSHVRSLLFLPITWHNLGRGAWAAPSTQKIVAKLDAI